MSEQEYLKRLKSALLVRGVWGNLATKMIEQLSDHYRGVMQELCEDGKSEQEARDSMESLIGSPENVANAAAEELCGKTLLGRHPWLIGGLGFFLGVFVCIGAILYFGVNLAFLLESLEGKYVPLASFNGRLQFVMNAVNWSPWVLACCILAWAGWRSPMGWKALIVTSTAIGLSSAAFVVSGISDTTGYVFISAVGGTGSFLVWSSWFKLLLPIIICLTAKNLLQKKPPNWKKGVA